MKNITVIIPALNEERAIGRVIAEIPRELNKGARVKKIIVADNGSTDNTARVAYEKDRERVVVVFEPVRGYGQACLTALARAEELDYATDIFVFLDGDYSDFPGEMYDLVTPLLDEGLDFVLGSRTMGRAHPGALLPQARFGNWLSGVLIRGLYGVRYTDLGPFRAIRAEALRALNMRDRNYGWTVEMQVKAARAGLKFREIPVSYKKRIGKSKVTGTIRGTVMAGVIILSTIFRLYFRKDKYGTDKDQG